MSDAPLSELVGRYLTEQCTVLIDAEPELRARAPVVHPTRVAIRRLRSTLRVFGDLFDVARAGALEDDLVWFAGLLGAVRDLDVLEARLTDRLAALPEQLVLGPVARQITEELQLRRQAGWAEVVAALDSEPYRRLIAEIRRWRSDTPFTAGAEVPATQVKRYVKAAGKKARRRLRRALLAHVDELPEAGELLHRARKAAKRHRYALELAQPLWGAKAEAAIAERKELQDVLGDHQDSLVAAAFLHEQGMRLGIRSGHNGFTYGLLYGRELADQATIAMRLRPHVR